MHAYGFSKQASAIICSYLSNRKQRIKINNFFRSWKDLILGVPQGSFLGALLFNIYLNDLFFFLKDVGECHFADDTTTYISDERLENVLKSLEESSILAISSFENNYMKLNTDKSHLIVLGYKHEQVWANIRKDLIWESSDVKVLGITIDTDPKFDKHILKLCSKANQKLSALCRMAKLLSFNKRGTLFEALWSLNLNIVRLLGYFLVDVPKIKFIGYMREPLQLFMLTTFPLLINYLLWTNLSVFTIKISRDP